MHRIPLCCVIDLLTTGEAIGDDPGSRFCLQGRYQRLIRHLTSIIRMFGFNAKTTGHAAAGGIDHAVRLFAGLIHIPCAR